MKKLILLLLFGNLCMFAKAGPSADSLAYQIQRKKINGMLDVRRQKFGQYDESLSMHTGIFGLQTKKDIRRSNEILMDIVQTDNDIFKQLKILLDYRTFEQTQVQTHSNEVENSALDYMRTINRLRNQLEQLKKETDQEIQHDNNVKSAYVGIMIALLALILFLLSKKQPVKA